MEAMLLTCGEVGYRRVSVEKVYKRYGGSRSQFYKFFSNKSECFTAAFATESKSLYERLLARIEGEGTKRERLEAALRELSAFISEEPARARALFVEVHVAGGDALELRKEVFERLTRVLDDACRETESRHSPPPSTSAFIIGALEQAVSSALVDNSPEEFSTAIPELAALVGSAYR
jgi:AcrR family transcriptional regulator